MAITANNTTLTFNDATTQTTSGVTAVNVSTGISSSGGKTPTLTNTGVTSLTAGTGISLSGSTGGVTITSTATGTVTSVATGNGLSGGTITGSGTLVIAAPSYQSVGSYMFLSRQGNPITPNDNYSGVNASIVAVDGGGEGYIAGQAAGTYRCLGVSPAAGLYLGVRIS
jgi:hypothetical protein